MSETQTASVAISETISEAIAGELHAGGHRLLELVWVVRRMEIDFKSPAKIDDLLVIETKVADVSGARIYMKQEITCEGRLLCAAMVEAVMITKQGKPRRFPAEWREAFLASK